MLNPRERSKENSVALWLEGRASESYGIAPGGGQPPRFTSGIQQQLGPLSPWPPTSNPPSPVRTASPPPAESPRGWICPEGWPPCLALLSLLQWKKQGDLTDTAGWGPSYRGDPVATKVSPFPASCPITAQELGYLSSASCCLPDGRLLPETSAPRTSGPPGTGSQGSTKMLYLPTSFQTLKDQRPGR